MMKLRLSIICLISLLMSFSLIAENEGGDIYYDNEISGESTQIQVDQRVTSGQETFGQVPVDRSKILLKLTHSLDNPRGQIDWFKKIYISGFLNVDLENQTKQDFHFKNSNDISVGGVKLNVDVDVNEWIDAHLGFFYSDDADSYYPTAMHKDCDHRQIDAEEAYITFVNFDKSSFYFRGGKQYLPFGRYHRYPILKSLTQQLSEIRETALEAGFVDESGLYGSLYTFHGLNKEHQNRHERFNNYGACLGYENLRHSMGFDIGVGYLYNMSDVGMIISALPMNHYRSRVGAFSGHIDVMSGPFDFMMRYVTALRHFDQSDLGYQDDSVVRGAKPQAGMIGAGYTFKLKGRESKLKFGYQCSREAYDVNPGAILRLPFERLFASYGVDVLEHVIVEFEFSRDHDYSVKHSGTGKYNHIATMRIKALLV